MTVPRFKLLDLAHPAGEIEMPDGRIVAVRSPNGYAQDILMKLADSALAVAREEERAEVEAHNALHPDEQQPMPDAISFPTIQGGEIDDLMRLLVPDFTPEDIKGLNRDLRAGIIAIASGRVKQIEELIAATKKTPATASVPDHETNLDTSSPPSPSTAVAPSAT